MFTLFFTADLQGSMDCWKKLLNAADLFRVDALIVGGNLTGSALQSIVREKGDTWHTMLGSAPLRVKGREKLSGLEERIRNMGRYPCMVSSEEAQELAQSVSLRQKRLELEVSLILRRWLELAEKKLRKKGVRLVMLPGEEDPLFIDTIIKESSAVQWAQGEIIDLTPTNKMISEGASCCKDRGDGYRFSDEEIFHHLQNRVNELGELYNHIFTIQVPPRDAALSDAPRLNCAREQGGREQHPHLSGCAAVRRFIETYQPLLSLHGYPRGRENTFTHIGRTLCLVPGSGRREGLLTGYLVTLNRSEIQDFQPIQG